MVKIIVHSFLYVLEVYDHALLVKGVSLAMYRDFPVMTVYIGARTVVWQVKSVASCYFQLFLYYIHAVVVVSDFQFFACSGWYGILMNHDVDCLCAHIAVAHVQVAAVVIALGAP